jgi:membrane protease YdiL (CAAX protease family)
MRLDVWAVLFLIVVGLGLPGLAVASSRMLDAGEAFPPRKAFYVETLVLLAIIGAASLGVAATNGIPLFPPFRFNRRDMTAATVALGLALGTLPLRWVTASEWRKRRLFMLVPHGRGEWLLWATVSLAAGVAEELAYRGVMATLVEWLTSSWGVAVLVCSASFAVVHVVQGWTSVATIALFAMGFHVLVRITGTLYPAMGVHVLYDLVAGIAYGWLGAGLVEERAEAQPAG